MDKDTERYLREAIQNTEAIKNLEKDLTSFKTIIKEYLDKNEKQNRVEFDELKAENKECAEWRKTVDISKKVAKPAIMFGALCAFVASFIGLLIYSPREGLGMLQSLIKQIWSRLM